MVIGYARFTDGFGVRKLATVGIGIGRKFKNVYETWDKGQVVPIYNVEDRELQLWISEGVVEILNMDKKPCSLDDLKQPKQQKVFVPEVKNTTKRPVLRKVKK